MSTELEQQLRDALHEDAQRARLLNPDRPPVPEARPLATVEPRRTARRVVAVAAAIALVATATVVLLRNRPSEDDQLPMGLDVFDELLLGDAPLYTDVAPGTSVDLPPAPIGTRIPAAVVWTGNELVVWGGRDAQDEARFDDGAAFDPATGTWRTLADAPIVGRDVAAVAWTGTELFIWGGYDRRGANPPLADGAAYNPTTDTWRVLPDAPIAGRYATAVWTGEEVVVVVQEEMAAYDPSSDEWRRLGDTVGGRIISSGKTFLAWDYGPNPYRSGSGLAISLLRYDLSRDTLESVYQGTESDTFIDITGTDGLTRGVLVLPSGSSTVTALDPAGETLGTLPPFPNGSLNELAVTWAGEEVLFTVLSSQGGQETWALHLGAETWRQLDFGSQPPPYRMILATEPGVLFGLREPSEETTGPLQLLVYRPPTPMAPTSPETDDPLALPAPGEQPPDPVAAEEEVRTAFTTIFDAS
jgi:hypothetical protein